MDIIYEDSDIVAVNKPAGLLVHGAMGTSQKTLTDWMIENVPEVKNIGDEPEIRPGIVHRLDRETSGVLLAVKNQKTFEYLKNLFQKRKIKKKYIALVAGDIPLPSGKRNVIDLPIGRSAKDFRKRASGAKLAGKIREALTEYEVLERFPGPACRQAGYTLVAAYPKTGRTHQIRVHFKAIGHPIVCDKLYGFKKADMEARCPFGLKRHFLHAAAIDFVLPSGARIKLEADLPDDLKSALEMLRGRK